MPSRAMGWAIQRGEAYTELWAQSDNCLHTPLYELAWDVTHTLFTGDNLARDGTNPHTCFTTLTALQRYFKALGCGCQLPLISSMQCAPSCDSTAAGSAKGCEARRMKIHNLTCSLMLVFIMVIEWIPCD